MKTSRTRQLRDIQFLLLSTLTFLLLFSVLRGLLLWRNRNLADAIPFIDLLQAFLIGIRFDLVVTCYILLPLVIFLFSKRGLGKRYLVRVWLASASALFIVAGIGELDFYREFHTRLNSLVFQYISDDPVTVSKMLWHGFPIAQYLLLALLLWLGFQYVIRLIDLKTAKPETSGYTGFMPWATRIVAGSVVLILTIGGARGSFSSGPPLRWGDAIHSEYTFASQLGLNGTFTLVKAASSASHSRLSRWWLDVVDREDALAVTRNMVISETDRLEMADKMPLLRYHQPDNGYPAGKIENIVLIIMESFAGAHVGALGDSANVTPAFDQLAEQGILFTRFFSNGTHTHQGMFATVACFPNLPGHEYLMQQPEGLQGFSSLPRLFEAAAENNVYLYNGDFRWDNQRGFFRHQGMQNFIGRDQIDNPKYLDAVWGASDEDVFHQAVKELDELARHGSFYAIIQTLSNHTPFSLPDPLPVKRVVGAGPVSEHLTAMRYADWALGEFFREIRKKDYFDKSLFVILGDHGFGTDEIVSDVDLSRFRVPLLLIGPALRDYYPGRLEVVGSQVDIVPTAISLLGKSFSHQCWGRDLLSLNSDDPGFAVVKPSGSDQTTAIIRGNNILTLSPETVPKLGKLEFGTGMKWRAYSNPTLAGELEHQLKSYINTALYALQDNLTGVPGSE